MGAGQLPRPIANLNLLPYTLHPNLPPLPPPSPAAAAVALPCCSHYFSSHDLSLLVFHLWLLTVKAKSPAAVLARAHNALSVSALFALCFLSVSGSILSSGLSSHLLPSSLHFTSFLPSPLLISAQSLSAAFAAITSWAAAPSVILSSLHSYPELAFLTQTRPMLQIDQLST